MYPCEYLSRLANESAVALGLALRSAGKDDLDQFAATVSPQGWTQNPGLAQSQDSWKPTRLRDPGPGLLAIPTLFHRKSKAVDRIEALRRRLEKTEVSQAKRLARPSSERATWKSR